MVQRAAVLYLIKNVIITENADEVSKPNLRNVYLFLSGSIRGIIYG